MSEDMTTEGAMDDSAQEAPAQGRTMQQIPPPGAVPIYYVNNVVFRTTYWDFTMDMGVILEASENRIVVQGMATVVMSPQHAQTFSEILADQLREYQEKFGPIPKRPGPDLSEGESAGE